MTTSMILVRWGGEVEAKFFRFPGGDIHTLRFRDSSSSEISIQMTAEQMEDTARAIDCYLLERSENPEERTDITHRWERSD